ncbi:MAG: glycoside hydrolase family 20 zincin-like fold domain-containing protein [Armatimonadota bacterium]|nr:glycoside hydrolase family 20 zincin-like fold domain-containing protein [bacterium]
MKIRIIQLMVCMFLLLSAAAVNATVLVEMPREDGMLPYTSELLKERLMLLTGEEVKIVSAGAHKADVRLKFDKSIEKQLGSEGYRISTGKDGATISAASPSGLLYGACGLIEWIMAETTPNLANKQDVDIDFPVKAGQAAKFFRAMPKTTIEDKPYYSTRGVELSNLGLGVADLIDTPKGAEKYNSYSQVSGGFRDTVEVWKNWCDWCARHRMNFITSWPYSAGTNWWDLASDPMTKGTSVYDADEIERSAEVRESLFKYARTRGLVPYLMNYVPGAASPAINRAYPDIIGVSTQPDYPTPYKLVGTKAVDMFRVQIRAIMRTYPSLGGLHLRWWGESFLSRGEGHAQLEGLALAIMESAKEARPDARFIMSGYFRSGGTKEFAAKLPQGSTIQSKWGLQVHKTQRFNGIGGDWEPSVDPDVPFDRIREVERPFLISQNLPGEEYHPIGGVQYRSLAKGVDKYFRAADQVPNLDGFATVSGEKDHEWITETNYITFARLNWNPGKTDVSSLIRNYLTTHYGSKVSEPAFKALELTQDALEEWVLDFAGIAPYMDYSRISGMFGLQRAQSLNPTQLKERLAVVTAEAGKLAEAYRLVSQAEQDVISEGKASYSDFLIQTKFYADFIESRRLMADASNDKAANNFDSMAKKLMQLKEMDKQMLQLAMSKPNISDDFEMEGMKTAVNMPPSIEDEIRQIDGILKPEVLSSFDIDAGLTAK